MSDHPPEFIACFQEAYGRVYVPQKPDYNRCCTAVYDGTARARYQCKRKNGRGPHGAYCAMHDPIRASEKRAARSAEIAARWDAERRRAAFAGDCQQAIRDIAAGHNDPRGLAQSILDKLNAPKGT